MSSVALHGNRHPMAVAVALHAAEELLEALPVVGDAELLQQLTLGGCDPHPVVL